MEEDLQALTKKVKDLEKLVHCLCITNFMTDHQDGDEKAREDSIRIINHHARRAKDRYNAYDAYGDLFSRLREIRESMMVYEQDYPELKEHTK